MAQRWSRIFKALLLSLGGGERGKLIYSPATLFLCSHGFHFPELRPFDAKVSGHFDDLPGINEVFGFRAKAGQGGDKLPASHRLWQS
jgi:hypothetical protein